MNPISHLTDLFTKFPGVGPRQARRFVYFLLHNEPKTAQELAMAISNIKANTQQCLSCFRFFTIKHQQKTTVCDICSDELTDHSTLLVVEKDADLETVKKIGTYKGLYFVIGGVIPILEKKPEKRIRILELVKKIKILTQNKELKEIILALSANTEGDNTAEYIQSTLNPIAKEFNLTISKLGRGLSTGSELEYSDPETIKSAIGNRTKT